MDRHEKDGSKEPAGEPYRPVPELWRLLITEVRKLQNGAEVATDPGRVTDIYRIHDADPLIKQEPSFLRSRFGSTKKALVAAAAAGTFVVAFVAVPVIASAAATAAAGSVAGYVLADTVGKTVAAVSMRRARNNVELPHEAPDRKTLLRVLKQARGAAEHSQRVMRRVASAGVRAVYVSRAMGMVGGATGVATSLFSGMGFVPSLVSVAASIGVGVGAVLRAESVGEQTAERVKRQLDGDGHDPKKVHERVGNVHHLAFLITQQVAYPERFVAASERGEGKDAVGNGDRFIAGDGDSSEWARPGTSPWARPEGTGRDGVVHGNGSGPTNIGL